MFKSIEKFFNQFQNRFPKLYDNSDFIAVLMATFCAFLFLFGFETLNVYNTDLVVKGGDFTVSYLGSVFYRLDEWRWPIFTHMNLAYPFGISVHGTDGSPLLSLIFKIFHKFFGLAADVQFVGIWMLICYTLQAVVSVLIFRLIFKSKFLIMCAAFFFVTAPIMYMRVFVHINLMAHFILLFSILMYFKNRLCFRDWIYMGILETMALLTCPYFLPMISGFFFLLFYQKVFVEKEVSIKTLIKGMLFLGFVFVFWFYLLGMLTKGQILTSGGWRLLSLNLTALFNPFWSRSQVFNSLTPKADFDADNYFGFGLLLMLLLLIYQVKDLFSRENLKKHAMLALLLIGFILFALSPQIKYGTTVLLDYKPGEFIEWLGSVFRYSGRFFWPIWYLLAFFLIKTLKDVYPKAVYFLLPLFLCIQIWDLVPTFQMKKEFVETTKPATFNFKSPEWNRLNQQYQNIFIFSHNQNYRDMWRWALKNHKNVNYGFLNRASKQTNDLVNKTRDELLSGYVVDPSYFYVIDDDVMEKINAAAQINPAVQKLRERIQKIDDYRILEYQPDLLPVNTGFKPVVIPVTHRYWQAELVHNAPYRVYRLLDTGYKDFATVIRFDENMLILKWDRFGQEEFKKEPDGRYHQILKETKEP